MRRKHKLDDRTEKLVERLRSLDSQRVKFFAAKKMLREEGYSEKEIVHALYIFSYDGEPNLSKEPHPVTKYFTANPAEADKIAKYILDNIRMSDYDKMAAYRLALRYAPGPHASAKRSLYFADEIGYPYFTLWFSIPISFALVLKFELDAIFIFAGPVLVTMYWLIKKLIDRVMWLRWLKRHEIGK